VEVRPNLARGLTRKPRHGLEPLARGRFSWPYDSPAAESSSSDGGRRLGRRASTKHCARLREPAIDCPQRGVHRVGDVLQRGAAGDELEHPLQYRVADRLHDGMRDGHRLRVPDLASQGRAKGRYGSPLRVLRQQPSNFVRAHLWVTSRATAVLPMPKSPTIGAEWQPASQAARTRISRSRPTSAPFTEPASAS